MKRNLFILPVTLFAIISAFLVGCDNYDDFVPETTIVNAFQDKYPDAKKVSWENKLDYKVAEFIQDNHSCEAWFDTSGKWIMTETDILFEQLPLPIQEHFVLSAYAGWRIDDVDKIERYNTETVYIIEVESGEQEVELYYSADGTLIKELSENAGESHQPVIITETINGFIASKYAGAKIVDYDSEINGIEVDIFHGGIYKDVYFNTSGEWLSTQWDIRQNEVPAIVLQSIASTYNGYEIEDIEYIETPEGIRYLFELEKGEKDIEVIIRGDGTFI